MLQREQLLQELVHDSYKSTRKLPEPTRMPAAARPATASTTASPRAT